MPIAQALRPYNCLLPTAPILTINGHGVVANPGNENAAAVSGGGGWIAVTPDDETVVAGSGVPGLFGEAGNELMCRAS
jgi:hypothetical protein